MNKSNNIIPFYRCNSQPARILKKCIEIDFKRIPNFIFEKLQNERKFK